MPVLYHCSFSELFLAPTKQIIGADGLEDVEKKTVKELNLLDPETDKESIHVQLS
ncbi:hypothetical protein RchiOBHm_Chr5g0018421 [Rosa chinensis]|uniref:Uncharacterized protein n=1 Tax=Rosa chinensis TaxID=74649 RepID=A0A2P6Q6R0_ROSCH|nr:hypothetical protein RchiOBHm_Chr5g0018421 [Rosa chinensis]